MNTATAPQSSTTDWLRQALIAGEVESANVKALAEQVGIGTKALRNARERLGVVHSRSGSGATMRSTWALPEGAGIRAHGSGGAGELNLVKVPAKVAPGATGAPTSPSVPVPKPARAPAHAAVTLSMAEHGRVASRARTFIARGLNEAAAGGLALMLVIERDRSSSKEGSCIECQCFEIGSSCAPGREGNAAGPRDPAEIWMCWCARRE